MLDAAYLIPAFPLLGFVVLVFTGSKLKEPLAGVIATLCCAGAFGATLLAFAGLVARNGDERQVTKVAFDWIPTIGVKVAFLVDPLSITMALFITGVGSLIHLYAIGYMHGDARFSRFFVYLNLFVFSMLMLVLGDSFLLMFLGWEGVGACSYLLISFWFERESAATAGKKAFIANRVGDVALMIGMFLVFSKVGSLTYLQVFHAVEGHTISQRVATGCCLLFFAAACGKSAQLPLYVWLPDAMEGPTPVSALIHAATMVTSGVYLMVRINPFFGLSTETAFTVIGWVGVITALFAASIACAQDDIKKVLAYSTISQLGYMFLAIGSKAYVAAIFHMVTHAFFKALMFLGAGSVIHGMHEQQDMKKMGRLLKYMPITAGTFLVGWLSIAGVPPFSGFWSKDDILLNAWHANKAWYVLGLLTALMTAYYMTRQIYLVFFGEERYGEPAHDSHTEEDGGLTTPEPVAHDDGHGDAHGGLPHESPPVMWIPLAVLAALAAFGGALNWTVPGMSFRLEHWLEPVIEPFFALSKYEPAHDSSSTKVLFSAVATLAGLAGIGLGFASWRRGADQPALEPEVLKQGWFYDSTIARIMGGPGRALADALAFKVDKGGIDGAVNGVATLVKDGGGQLRKLQTGYVRNYALGLTGGAVFLLGYVAFLSFR